MAAYRVLVTGSRDWDDAATLRMALIDAVADRPAGTEPVIVHGACPRGADAMADTWARDYGYRTEPHPADWDRHGRGAGFRRNAEMVNLGASACLAFFKQGAGNKGTEHCAGLAEAAGIRVRRIDG